jgi:hypothetical protein
MASITDRDKDVFSNLVETISDRFTEFETKRIHEMALELDLILNSIKAREDKSSR